jgi:hypothetical protein
MGAPNRQLGRRRPQQDNGALKLQPGSLGHSVQSLDGTQNQTDLSAVEFVLFRFFVGAPVEQVRDTPSVSFLNAG